MHSINGNSTNTNNSAATTATQITESIDSSEIIETLSTYSNNHHHHSILKNTNDLLKCQNLISSSSSSNGHLINQKQFTNGQKDILRLIGQHLRQLGLTKTTEQLINESGCMLEHPVATNFSNLILNGDWDKAERSLIDLKSIIDLNTDIIVSLILS